MCVRLSPQELDSIYEDLVRGATSDFKGFKIIPTKDEVCSNSQTANGIKLDYTWIRPIDIRKCIQMGIIRDKLSMGSVRHKYRFGGDVQTGNLEVLALNGQEEFSKKVSYFKTFEVKRDGVSIGSFTIHELCMVYNDVIYSIGYLSHSSVNTLEILPALLHQCLIEGYVFLLGREEVIASGIVML